MASSTLWSYALHVLPGAPGADGLLALSTLLGGLERWEMALGMLQHSEVGSWAALFHLKLITWEKKT